MCLLQALDAGMRAAQISQTCHLSRGNLKLESQPVTKKPVDAHLTHQLQILAGDRLFLKKAINNVYSEEKRVWQQLELLVDLHKPVNENSTHLCIDVSLLQAQCIISGT